MSDSNTPLLDTLTMMTEASVEQNTETGDLTPREFTIARLAALAAVGAQPISWLVNAREASEQGISKEDVQGVFVAIAPIVGTARIVGAVNNIAQGLGYRTQATDQVDEKTVQNTSTTSQT